MRKEYGNVLRRVFTARLKEVAPHFQARHVTSAYCWPGERAYAWHVTANVWCWIVLSPSQKDDDAFTILVGWSTRGRYPEQTILPFRKATSETTGEFAQEEYLTRLPFLWGNEDTWWVVRPFTVASTTQDLHAWIAPIAAAEAEQQVIPVVEDAMNRLVAVGLPYLTRFAHFVTHGQA